MNNAAHLILLVALGCVAPLSANAGPSNACALLTPANISNVVGVSMGDGTALNSASASNCKWLQQGVDGLKAVTVIVSTKAAEAFEMGKRVMQPVSVSGIGDDAYLTGASLSYTVLSVRKGQAALTVTVRGLKDVASTQAAEKALGKAAVGKL